MFSDVFTDAARTKSTDKCYESTAMEYIVYSSIAATVNSL